MPIIIEEEYATRRGMTLNEWKKRGKELLAIYDENQRAGRHPYKGISDSDAGLLNEYENWISEGF